MVCGLSSTGLGDGREEGDGLAMPGEAVTGGSAALLEARLRLGQAALIVLVLGGAHPSIRSGTALCCQEYAHRWWASVPEEERPSNISLYPNDGTGI